jgi:hypothetical protein
MKEFIPQVVPHIVYLALLLMRSSYTENGRSQQGFVALLLPPLLCVIITPFQTPVSQTPHFTHMNPSIFPDPKTFLPERWLRRDIDESNPRRYLLPFGKRTRQCAGMK